MKSRQFCSVCKQWLDMEVVPTGDGDDDGVVWFRCPQCQGFLPKLSSAVEVNPVAADGADGDDDDPAGGQAGSGIARAAAAAAAVPADTEVDILDIDLAEAAALAADADDVDDDDDAEEAEDAADDVGSVVDDDVPPPMPAGATAAEPVLEYAAMLAAVDPGAAIPYRPWASYEVGQCILHLAWNDCGVVVAKEPLPGGRQVIKCWFQGAGVVRLIENAPR
ncbi:MAG: hypothetical protein IPH48_02120 [bacterium]|jgi:hypothetical protein|nr:hypothetical protein [bacterium]